ncbi:uncharacterized protein LOC120346045 [Styela clava]
MSGDGRHRQSKINDDDDLQNIQQHRDEDEPDARPERPMTAPTRRPTRRRGPDPPGAVGGEGISYQRGLSEQERRVGGQAHLLLEMFILDRIQRDPMSSRHRDQVQTAVCQDDMQQEKQSFSDHGEDHLDDVACALRDIGDQLAQDYDLNNLIDMVPIKSPKEIFMKVCRQMFDDGQFNWGRVVALFYFAYRLITKAVATAVDSIPWVKEIFKWAIDFFCQYVAWWIIQRGGWAMIREWWGPSTRTMSGLGVMAVMTLVYVWWKQQ